MAKRGSSEIAADVDMEIADEEVSRVSDGVGIIERMGWAVLGVFRLKTHV